MLRSQTNLPGSCLSSSESGGALISAASGAAGGVAISRRKGDFVLQTGHVIEIITKLFLVVQNATGKPPNVNIATEFEANFGGMDTAHFTFKTGSQVTGQHKAMAGTNSGQVKLIKRGNRFEVIV